MRSLNAFLANAAMTSLLATTLALAGCGSSVPPPTDKMASAEAASRSARELGASGEPKAALHLKLAEEQIDQAKKLMTDGDNRRAELVLERASSDAELSVMLAKENAASQDAAKAKERVNALKAAK
ncbi:MAG: hypothetical protein JWP97_615 [Labilithrix sp.]|nr:hypothetical protein [Labilithrix sp.]